MLSKRFCKETDMQTSMRICPHDMAVFVFSESTKIPTEAVVKPLNVLTGSELVKIASQIASGSKSLIDFISDAATIDIGESFIAFEIKAVQLISKFLYRAIDNSTNIIKSFLILSGYNDVIKIKYLVTSKSI